MRTFCGSLRHALQKLFALWGCSTYALIVVGMLAVIFVAFSVIPLLDKNDH